MLLAGDGSCLSLSIIVLGCSLDHCHVSNSDFSDCFVARFVGREQANDHL